MTVCMWLNGFELGAVRREKLVLTSSDFCSDFKSCIFIFSWILQFLWFSLSWFSSKSFVIDTLYFFMANKAAECKIIWLVVGNIPLHLKSNASFATVFNSCNATTGILLWSFVNNLTPISSVLSSVKWTYHFCYLWLMALREIIVI